ncbi:MAG: T9SS type A sorting domain-containing protein [Saprospiraceae bacterium]|nr:T9SS type A sorting domain-containing protein [Saprospiraceae bacterium]
MTQSSLFSNWRRSAHAPMRRLLGQPVTQAAYEDILDIAEQEATEYGEAVSDAVLLLFPCDQEQFLGIESMEEEERPQGTTKVEETPATGIKVMPNPTTGITEVILPTGFTGSANVVDASGRQILSQAISEDSSKLKLDLSQQNIGLYWLILSDASGSIRFTEKIALYR